MNTPKRVDLFNIEHRIEPGIYRISFSTPENALSFSPTLFIKAFKDIKNVKAVYKGSYTECIFPLGAKYIEEGDIAAVSHNSIRIILSKAANANTLLVTERCDNLCLFCSQPPKEVDDDILLGMAAQALIEFETSEEVGISGGEPLLYGDKFISFLSTLNSHKNNTPLHILTNGRALSNIGFVNRLKKVINEADRMVTFGIPLYSLESKIHDRIVGSKGAWQETIYGLINAMYAGLSIEVRFIPTKLNLNDLKSIGAFIARTLPAINQLSIMNLEPKGWARKNWDKLYIDPQEYGKDLKKCIVETVSSDLSIRLFNYPLCHLPEQIGHLAVQSISDWKNYYLDECNNCSKMSTCCGFFTSSTGKFLQEARTIYEK